MGSKKKATKVRKTKIVYDEPLIEIKDPEERTHHPFEQWMVDALVLALENKEHLSAWEKDFVKDRAGAFDKYGFSAVITDKQIKVLNNLNSKLKLKVLIKRIDE